MKKLEDLKINKKSKQNLIMKRTLKNCQDCKPKIAKTKQTTNDAFINKTIKASTLLNRLLYAEVFEAHRTRWLKRAIKVASGFV